MSAAKRVLFLNPPRFREGFFTLRDEICFQDVIYAPFPLRLAQVAAQVRRNPAFAVEAIDATAEKLSWDDLEARLPEADVVVLQSAAGLLRHDLRAAEMVKKKTGPRAKTVLIESVVSPVFPERVLTDFPAIDYLVLGQPEMVIPPLLENLDAPEKTKGVAFRSNGTVQATPSPSPNPDLDGLPFMAYDLFPMDRYSICYVDATMYQKTIPGVTVRMSRDCPYACAFCIIGSSIKRGYDRVWRSMSPKRVVDELEHIVRTYGIRGFYFWDEVFTIQKKRAEVLCDEIIARRLDIMWRCLSRVDLVDRTLLEKMAAAGCRLIEYGIEAGDSESRIRVNKKFEDDLAIQAVREAQRAGIRVNCDLIIGMPWETRETLRATLDLGRRLEADNVHLSMAFPYPDTEFYRIAEREDLLIVPDLYERMLDERVRVEIKPVVRSRALGAEELVAGWNRARKGINRHYFFRNLLLRPAELRAALRREVGTRGILGLIPRGLRYTRENLL